MRRGQKDPTGSMPFYAPPSKYKTSAEIIREARAHIHIGNAEGASSGVSGAPRPLVTQRPFTPRDRQRTLFGKAGKASRPPSAVSLRYLQLQSTDSLMSSSPSVKRVHLSPMPTTLSASLDEGVFKRLLLDNIDEKPELSGVRKKRSDAGRRTKSLQLELEQEVDNSSSGNGSKFKLPCLNGLAKPLHQRKSPAQLKSPFALHSLSEEREELGNQSLYSPSVSKSTETKSSVGSKERIDSIEIFPSPTQAITLDIFNKRRLFSDFKSKSEETKVDVPFKQFEKKIDRISSSVTKKADKSSGDIQIRDSHRNDDMNIDDNDSVDKRSNTMKIAFQIPSPDLTSTEVTPRFHMSTFKDFSPKAPEVVKESKIILSRLNEGGPKQFSDDVVITDLKLLFDALEREGLWHDIGRDEKAFILKTLYKYVESSNEKLLMAIARIILSLRVTGSNLSGICKLIFKVARNDKNDHLFFIDNTLELFMIGLGSAEPLHDAECLVYGYGALKFLGMSPTLLEKMKPIGALPLMALHLKMFNQARLEDTSTVGEQGCHALYQLTGALRNMAGHTDIVKGTALSPSSELQQARALKEFLDTGAMVELCRTVKLFADDLDVETNVSRTLSVLSADYDCCVVLCEQKSLLTSAVKLLGRYTERAPLVVRLNYILGNMVACSDNTRLQLYEEPGATDALLKVLEVYLKRCWPGGEFDTAENIIIGSDLDGSSGSDEDVMVKTVRVLANMCMNPSVGASLALEPGGGPGLLAWLLACLRSHSSVSSPQLVVSALATLNNLTYYHQGGDSEAFYKMEIDLCEVLCRLLTLDVSPCVTEAIRVLGNMSRTQVTREYIVETGALMNITRLLVHDDEETSLAAAGVLVNMAADPSARSAWLSLGGVRSAITALQNSASHHSWAQAQLLSQALWNAAPLNQTDTSLLSPLLLNMLDEQQVFGNMESFHQILDEFSSSPTKSMEEDVIASHMAWEEFAAVAVNLLEKVDPTLDSPGDEENEEFMFGVKMRTMSESDLVKM